MGAYSVCVYIWYDHLPVLIEAVNCQDMLHLATFRRKYQGNHVKHQKLPHFSRIFPRFPMDWTWVSQVGTRGLDLAAHFRSKQLQQRHLPAVEVDIRRETYGGCWDGKIMNIHGKKTKKSRKCMEMWRFSEEIWCFRTKMVGFNQEMCCFPTFHGEIGWFLSNMKMFCS